AVEPDGGGDGEEDGGGEHGVGSAERVQEGNEREAAGGGPQQIEEINAIDAFDGLGDYERDNRSAQKERQGAGEVDERQRERTELTLARDDEHQREQDGDAVQGGEDAEFTEEASFAGRYNIGKDP